MWLDLGNQAIETFFFKGFPGLQSFNLLQAHCYSKRRSKKMQAYVQKILKDVVNEPSAKPLVVRDMPRIKLTLLQSGSAALLPKESVCCNLATD